MTATAEPTTAVTHVTRRREVASLTGFRFFAASLVVIYHYGHPLWPYLPRGVRGAVLNGPAWVTYFFVLSGFILTFTYLDVARSSLAVAPKKFFRARVARLFPTYALAWALAAPFAIAHRFAVDPPAIASAKTVVEGATTLIAMQAWVPPLTLAWNPPSWTLSLEIFFYAMFPFLVARMSRSSTRRNIAFVLLLVAVSVAAGMAVKHAIPEGSRWNAATHLPILHLHEFALGILAALIFQRHLEAYFAGRPVAASIAQVVSFAAILAVLELPQRITFPLIESGALSPLFAAAVLFQAVEHGWVARFLAIRPLRVLGHASYAQYILQAPIMMIWMRAGGPTTSVAGFCAYFAALTMTSLILVRRFEEPLRSLLLRVGQR